MADAMDTEDHLSSDSIYYEEKYKLIVSQYNPNAMQALQVKATENMDRIKNAVSNQYLENIIERKVQRIVKPYKEAFNKVKQQLVLLQASATMIDAVIQHTVKTITANDKAFSEHLKNSIIPPLIDNVKLIIKEVQTNYYDTQKTTISQISAKVLKDITDAIGKETDEQKNKIEELVNKNQEHIVLIKNSKNSLLQHIDTNIIAIKSIYTTSSAMVEALQSNTIKTFNEVSSQLSTSTKFMSEDLPEKAKEQRQEYLKKIDSIAKTLSQVP